jgi:hypothetical protein
MTTLILLLKCVIEVLDDPEVGPTNSAYTCHDVRLGITHWSIYFTYFMFLQEK